MKRNFCLILTTVLAVALTAHAADDSVTPDVYFHQTVTPLLQKYCYQCHSGAKPKADLALNSFNNVESILQHREQWELLLKNVRTVEMPPPETKLKPTDAEREII